MLRDILIQRLIERSTWVGITLVAGALGAGHNPERIDSIATGVAIVVGLLAMFWPDRDPCRGIRQRGNGPAEGSPEPDKHMSGYFRWTQGTRKDDRERRKREKREDFEAREEYRERKKKRRKRDHLS